MNKESIAHTNLFLPLLPAITIVTARIIPQMINNSIFLKSCFHSSPFRTNCQLFFEIWLRGKESNLLSLVYEASELPFLFPALLLYTKGAQYYAPHCKCTIGRNSNRSSPEHFKRFRVSTFELNRAFILHHQLFFPNPFFLFGTSLRGRIPSLPTSFFLVLFPSPKPARLQ